MSALKLSNEQLIEYLRKGMTMKEIARIVDMSYPYIWQRVKKLDFSGELMEGLMSGEEYDSIRLDDGTLIRRMDTLARLSSKQRYRVAHVYEGSVVLKEVVGDDYRMNHTLKPIMVTKAVLQHDFEKKEIGTVKCYVDKSLIEKLEEKSVDEKKRREKDVDAFLCDYKHRR